MDLRFTDEDEAFRSDVAAFLETELGGTFSAVRHRGQRLRRERRRDRQSRYQAPHVFSCDGPVATSLQDPVRRWPRAASSWGLEVHDGHGRLAGGYPAAVTTAASNPTRNAFSSASSTPSPCASEMA